MLSNIHTHTTLCDGNDTPEEMVLQAIEMGFDSLGFSGHAPTPPPLGMEYTMRNIDAYILEINRLKEMYKNDIQIYLGVEEEGFCPVNRGRFDYIIGSLHLIENKGKFYSIDESPEHMKKCIDTFDGNYLSAVEAYYSRLCDYVLKRKPDVVGHFDLITKYEGRYTDYFFSQDGYFNIAKKYITEAAKSECIFEVNNGAIAKGYRNTPYPSRDLLYVLKKLDAKLTVTSDCHNKTMLDYNFKECKKMLKDIGFEHIYVLYNNTFMKERL